MSVLEKALAFLREHNEAAFATVEAGKPKIRVFQIMRIEGETLYFATAPHKEVIANCRRTRTWNFSPWPGTFLYA